MAEKSRHAFLWLVDQGARARRRAQAHGAAAESEAQSPGQTEVRTGWAVSIASAAFHRCSGCKRRHAPASAPPRGVGRLRRAALSGSAGRRIRLCTRHGALLSRVSRNVACGGPPQGMFEEEPDPERAKSTAPTQATWGVLRKRTAGRAGVHARWQGLRSKHAAGLCG